LKQRLHGGKDKFQSCPLEVQYVVWLYNQFANTAVKSIQKVCHANINSQKRADVTRHVVQTEGVVVSVLVCLDAFLSNMIISTKNHLLFFLSNSRVSCRNLPEHDLQPDLIHQKLDMIFSMALPEEHFAIIPLTFFANPSKNYL